MKLMNPEWIQWSSHSCKIAFYGPYPHSTALHSSWLLFHGIPWTLGQLIQMPYLELNTQKLIIFSTYIALYFCAKLCLLQQLLWPRLKVVQLYGDNDKHLEHSLMCSFSKTAVLGSPLGAVTSRAVDFWPGLQYQEQTSEPIRKQLAPLITLIPLLHQWASLAWRLVLWPKMSTVI